MYPSDITYHFTTGTLIPRASSTFYTSHQRITTVNMKNLKAKDGSRSSQIPSFQIYLTYPGFHIEVFSLITSCECIPWQRDLGTNACLKRQYNNQTSEFQPPCSHSRRAFQDIPMALIWIHLFVFRDNLAEKGWTIYATRPPPSLVKKLS